MQSNHDNNNKNKNNNKDKVLLYWDLNAKKKFRTFINTHTHHSTLKKK
jgi:hypothetical protein